MKKLILVIGLIFSVLTVFGSDTINVAMKESPPFTMQESNGEWSGVCIDLLDKISNKLGITYQIYELHDNYNQIINKVADDKYDIFVGSTTINADRLQKVDFTQPFFVGSISIATDVDHGTSAWAAFFTWRFMKMVIILGLIIVAIGAVFWAFEREVNENVKKNWMGIFDGAFFVSFTMTTVGYTDSVKTKAGKWLAFILMWVSIGLVGAIYGNITTALTVSQLESNVTDFNEMRKLKVGSIHGTTSANFLDKNDIRYIGYNDVTEGLDAINSGELDAFVYDTPILQYLVGQGKYKDINLAPQVFSEETYGFATPKGSDLIDKVNPIIINEINSDNWNRVLLKYNIK